MIPRQELPIQITAPVTDPHAELLTQDALAFLGRLAWTFETRRRQLLADRRERQAALDAGTMPGFLNSTMHVRQSEWQVAPIPADLLDRRVEITVPVERKMIIKALNSGHNVYMACLDDYIATTRTNEMR